MKVIVSYLVPQEQEFEIPDKFNALAAEFTSSWTELHELEEEFDRYVEREIRPTIEAKTQYGIDFCSIMDENDNMLAEW